MNEDFLEVLAELRRSETRFLVVGAHAMAVHGVARATGDLDIWIDRSHENAQRVWQALQSFGAPLQSLGVGVDDFERPDMVIQIGIPPRRIDVLTGVSGLEFEEAWMDRLVVFLGAEPVPFLGRTSLVRNKRSTGRLKDLADLEALGE